MTGNQAEILAVEDDKALQRNLKQGLSDIGYHVHLAGSLDAARRAAAESAPGLLLLDLGLPDGSGFDFLKEFKSQHPRVPVVILTARDQLPDKIKGLDLGADDYLVKPFDFQELAARIRAQLRRSLAERSEWIKVDDLEIDLVKRSVIRSGVMIELTPREFDVLVYMARSPGQPVSRTMLMRDVWKIHARLTSMDNVIDVLMSRLREKIDGNAKSKIIMTVRGVGYKIMAPS